MKIHLGAEGWKDKGYEQTISNNPNEKAILAIDFPRQIAIAKYTLFGAVGFFR
jgi:hypothetical protein